MKKGRTAAQINFAQTARLRYELVEMQGKLAQAQAEVDRLQTWITLPTLREDEYCESAKKFEKKRDEAYAKLAQAQVDKELAQQGHLTAAREVTALRAELAQARAELAQAEFQLAQLAGAEGAFLESTARAQGAEARAEQLRTELAQAHANLLADSITVRQLIAQMIDLRTELAQARAELARELQAAQDWLSPAEAEGLKRQLGVLQAAVDNLCEQQDRQFDMEECGARCSYPSKFPEWETAWEQAYELRYDSSETTAQLSKRLVIPDAAEEAAIIKAAEALLSQEARKIEAAKILLSPQRRKYLVMSEDYKNLQDALEYRSEAAAKLLERLAELDAVHRRGKADARLAAHVHELSIGLERQAVRAERQLRQEAERELRQRQRQIDLLSGAEMRAHQAEQRAERAEALAADRQARAVLVDYEAAALLVQLASNTRTLIDASIDAGMVSEAAIRLWRNDTKAARELAAKIREALDDDQT